MKNTKVDNLTRDIDRYVWMIVSELEANKDSTGRIHFLFNKYKLTGKCSQWWPDGHLQIIHYYKAGLLDGLCMGWYANGSMRYSENWKEGKWDGAVQGWYSNGNLEYDERYRGGIRI